MAAKRTPSFTNTTSSKSISLQRNDRKRSILIPQQRGARSKREGKVKPLRFPDKPESLVVPFMGESRKGEASCANKAANLSTYFRLLSSTGPTAPSSPLYRPFVCSMQKDVTISLTVPAAAALSHLPFCVEVLTDRMDATHVIAAEIIPQNWGCNNATDLAFEEGGVLIAFSDWGSNLPGPPRECSKEFKHTHM